MSGSGLALRGVALGQFNITVNWTPITATIPVPNGTAVLSIWNTSQSVAISTAWPVSYPVIAMQQNITGAPNALVDFASPITTTQTVAAGTTWITVSGAANNLGPIAARTMYWVPSISPAPTRAAASGQVLNGIARAGGVLWTPGGPGPLPVINAADGQGGSPAAASRVFNITTTAWATVIVVYFFTNDEQAISIGDTAGLAWSTRNIGTTIVGGLPRTAAIFWAPCLRPLTTNITVSVPAASSLFNGVAVAYSNVKTNAPFDPGVAPPPPSIGTLSITTTVPNARAVMAMRSASVAPAPWSLTGVGFNVIAAGQAAPNPATFSANNAQAVMVDALVPP